MKYLPSEIEINGVTYYSGLELASKQLDWYNLGLAAGKKEATLEKVDQFNKGYEIGKYEGYEAGKKANGYTVDDIKQLHTDNEFTRKVWYDKGKAEGYAEGYNDGYEQCKHDHQIEDDSCKDCKEEPGRDDDDPIGPEQTEYAKGYAEGKDAGFEEGYERGFMDLRLVLKK